MCSVQTYAPSRLQCDECAEYGEDSSDYPNGVPIDEALDVGVPHPNCRCTWVVVEDKDTGLYTNPVQS